MVLFKYICEKNIVLLEKYITQCLWNQVWLCSLRLLKHQFITKCLFTSLKNICESYIEVDQSLETITQAQPGYMMLIKFSKEKPRLGIIYLKVILTNFNRSQYDVIQFKIMKIISEPRHRSYDICFYYFRGKFNLLYINIDLTTIQDCQNVHQGPNHIYLTPCQTR